MRASVLSLVLVGLCLLVGCATFPEARPWTREEKILLVASILAAGANYWTTERGLDRGGWEMNPLLGEHPTDTELTVKGWGCYGGILLAAHYCPRMRGIILGGSTLWCFYWTIYDAEFMGR